MRQDKNDRLIFENESLKAALVKYGAHISINCCYGMNPGEGYVCRCGLYDIIDAEAHLAALDPGVSAEGSDALSSGQ